MNPLINNIIKACAIYTNPINRKLKPYLTGSIGQDKNIFIGIIDEVPFKSGLVKLGNVLDRIITENQDYAFSKINNDVVDYHQGNLCIVESLHLEYTTGWAEENGLNGYIYLVVTVSYNELDQLGTVMVSIHSELD